VKFYKPGTKQEDFEKKCSEVISDFNEDPQTHFVETEDDEEDLEEREWLFLSKIILLKN
ncbi:unnamed protein product, partial [Brachionus calyciflorus]